MMAKLVLKSLKSRSYRFVVVLLLLCTLLTFNVGRVYRVEAVATTASLVGTVLLGLGVTYVAYQTLTGANVYVPDLTDDQSYITELGRQFSMTASGNRLFQNLYNNLIADNTYSVIDFTTERLLDIYNDHKSIADMQLESSFDFSNDVSLIPINGFDYPFEFTSVPETVGYYSFDYFRSLGYQITEYTGTQIVAPITGGYTISYTNLPTDRYYRNYWNGSVYKVQYSNDGQNWQDMQVRTWYGFSFIKDSTNHYLRPQTTTSYVESSSDYYFPSTTAYPQLPMERIYDSTNDEYMPLVPVDSSGHMLTPQYPQNDNNDGSKYPLVPFVELPSTLKWGFNWRDALTDLVNGGARLVTSAWLADLINDFKTSLSGSGSDIDYNFYNNGDTYYFTYYSDVVNDIYNPVYNINIEGQEDVIPVDLNTIEQYTDNVYLDTVKSSTLAFGSAIAEYFIFWHNADPVLFYTLCGSFIVILLGAFIGKWGHS